VAIKAPQGSDGRLTLAVLGIIGAAAGGVTFMYPDITAVALVYIIAAWAILRHRPDLRRHPVAQGDQQRVAAVAGWRAAHQNKQKELDLG